MKNGPRASTFFSPCVPGHLRRAQLSEPAALWPKALPLGGPGPSPHHGQPPRKVKCGPGKGGRGLLPAGKGCGWKRTKEARSQAKGFGVGRVLGPWGGGGMAHLCGHRSWEIVSPSRRVCHLSPCQGNMVSPENLFHWALYPMSSSCCGQQAQGAASPILLPLCLRNPRPAGRIRHRHGSPHPVSVEGVGG